MEISNLSNLSAVPPQVYVVCRGFSKSPWLTQYLEGVMEHYGSFPTDR